MTFAEGKEKVAQLCRFFETNRAVLLAPTTKEAHIRQNLIDPLFEALGWDVANRARVAPQYREVVPEDSLDVDGHQRAPDYTFRVGSQPRFYAEAKKCGVNLNADPAPAHQLRRYGWSAKVPVSLLTDFEEFAVYDCTLRPRPSDRASRARTHYYRFEEYPDRWREIWDVFSREAVWSGAFDQFAASQRKRGTSEVDDEFLKEIEGWRDALARNIALRNKALSSDDLNAAVQRTIDRIVFLRMAEDRGLEPYEQLLTLCERPNIYARFMSELCRKADDKYNSGIFHFNKEPGVSETPDRITPKLVVDDKTFRDILRSLYFVHGSPYDFGVMPVEILGTVYERFLGKVIRLTPSHQARVEEKPEVRKAGGVYYTPAYIVDYIVEQTVGRAIAGKSPRQIAGGRSRPPLRILDMACGSGSFLLGAYQRLLDHCLKWYVDHTPEDHPKAVYFDARRKVWRLTIEEKKRILTTHLFGVDIDGQAVEVTKLSLLLKALEGEDDATLSTQLELFRDRALPNLADNIQCGNSLIGPDYFTSTLLPDPEEIRRVNPFDWRHAFPAAMQDGGFDCIIGNPPYVRQETLGRAAKEYFAGAYRVYHGVADLYVYFIERAVQLLRPGGLFSYIVANKWMRANYGEPLRRWLQEQVIEEIVDFGDLPVFKGATTYPCIIRLAKAAEDDAPESPPPLNATKIDTLAFADLSEYVAQRRFTVDIGRLDPKGWSLTDNRTQALLDKVRGVGVPLGDYVQGRIYRGVLTGLNEAFVIDRATRDRLIAEDANSAELIKPFLAGRDVKRYQPPASDRYLIFARRGVRIQDYPAIQRHLLAFRERLAPRPDGYRGRDWKGRKPGNYQWYEIQDTVDYYEAFEKPKIIVPSIVKSASYTFDTRCFYSNDKTCIIAVDDLYLLGLLNSRTLDLVVHALSSTKRGGYYEYKPMYVTQLPIRPIDLSDPPDRAAHDRMVQLVTSMLELHRRLAAATSEAERTLLERQIAATDAEIDRLVYGLYGLSDEEIAVVESGE